MRLLLGFPHASLTTLIQGNTYQIVRLYKNAKQCRALLEVPVFISPGYLRQTCQVYAFADYLLPVRLDRPKAKWGSFPMGLTFLDLFAPQCKVCASPI